MIMFSANLYLSDHFEVWQILDQFTNRFKFDGTDLSLTALKLWKKRQPESFDKMKKLYRLKAFL